MGRRLELEELEAVSVSMTTNLITIQHRCLSLKSEKKHWVLQISAQSWCHVQGGRRERSAQARTTRRSTVAAEHATLSSSSVRVIGRPSSRQARQRPRADNRATLIWLVFFGRDMGPTGGCAPLTMPLTDLRAEEEVWFKIYHTSLTSLEETTSIAHACPELRLKYGTPHGTPLRGRRG